MASKRLGLRLILAADEKIAAAEVRSLTTSGRFESASIDIKPYWKNPELQQVSIYVDVSDEVEATFAQLAQSVGEGWEMGGNEFERWGVWNKGGESRLPSLQWANLEMFDAAAAEADDDK